MLIKIIKLFFNTKFTLFPPKKSKLLLFDIHSKQIVSKIFKLRHFIFLKTRKEEINLYVLFKTFLKFQFNFFDYLINYINFCESEIIITSIDNNSAFYKIKSRLNVTTIFFQNGVRTGYNDIFEIFEKKKKLKIIKKNNYVDLMCVFNNMTGSLYEKFISGKTLVSGSILSNSEKINKKKKKELVYVSLFRSQNKRKIEANEINLIKSLQKYCIQKKLKFKILCKYPNHTEIGNEEIFFYKSILKKNYAIISNKPKRNSYKLLDTSKIVVSPGSTMGMESLGRKNKTVIFNPFANRHPIKRDFFGYFTKRKDSGFFWHNGVNEKKIFKILNNVNDCKNDRWVKIIKKYEFETTFFDLKNTELKKKLIKFMDVKKHNIRKHLRY